MHQLKSLFHNPFKGSYSHPLHTCFAIIASNGDTLITADFPQRLPFALTLVTFTTIPHFIKDMAMSNAFVTEVFKDYVFTGICLSTGGITVQGGLCLRESLFVGVSVHGGSLSVGVSVCGSLCLWVSVRGSLSVAVSVWGSLFGGSLSRGSVQGISVQEGVSVQGDLCLGYLCLGDLCPGRSMSRGGLCLWVSVTKTPLLLQCSNVRAVRILLECILV